MRRKDVRKMNHMGNRTEQAKFIWLFNDLISRISVKQIYFFKLVSERTKTIGVRGAFTAHSLEKMRIKNIGIIGAPSLYLANEHYPIMKNPGMERIMYTADKTKPQIYDLEQQTKVHLIRHVYSDGAE